MPSSHLMANGQHLLSGNGYPTDPNSAGVSGSSRQLAVKRGHLLAAQRRILAHAGRLTASTWPLSHAAKVRKINHNYTSYQSREAQPGRFVRCPMVSAMWHGHRTAVVSPSSLWKVKSQSAIPLC